MCAVLIIGATRGLGWELAMQYAARDDTTVYGTTRNNFQWEFHSDAPLNFKWIMDVDLTNEKASDKIVDVLRGDVLDIVIVSAGYFGKETFDEPSWSEQLTMYTTSSIAPVFVVQRLFKAKLLGKGTKVLLISSESGSITLRHESEGGGNYGHHASKAALNMVGKLLSLDLKPHGVAVGMLHPGFMRSDMTKSVGFDKFWEAGGGTSFQISMQQSKMLITIEAVAPAEAAESLVKFIDTFDMSKTGTYWAPRGPGDIGTAEQTMGPKDTLSTPLPLPW